MITTSLLTHTFNILWDTLFSLSLQTSIFNGGGCGDEMIRNFNEISSINLQFIFFFFFKDTIPEGSYQLCSRTIMPDILQDGM